MKKLLLVFVFQMILVSISFSKEMYLLEDTQCKLLFAKSFVGVSKGTLTSSICGIAGKHVICKFTAKNGTMLGGKKSDFTSYKLIHHDKESAVWEYQGGRGYTLALFKLRNYRLTQTNILPSGDIVTKSCVGVITQLPNSKE